MDDLALRNEAALDLPSELIDLAAEATEHWRELEDLEAAVEAHQKDTLAENTKRAYRAGWEQFVAFCEEHDLGYEPASPRTVVLFMAHLWKEGYAFGTIENRLTGISVNQDRIIREIADGEREPDTDAGELVNPARSDAARKYRKALRRKMDISPDQKEPLLIEHLQQMEAAGLFEGVKGTRDRALLLIGFAGAFRRSELTSFNIEDVKDVQGGKALRLRKSKADQEGEGYYLGIPDEAPAFKVSPTEALERWLQLVDEPRGPVFRGVDRWGNIRDGRLSDVAVYNIVCECVEAIGEPPARYGAHSLRAGLVTQGYMDGIGEHEIAKLSRHKDREVLREYERANMVMQNHPLTRMGR